jgi:beta-galactosidase
VKIETENMALISSKLAVLISLFFVILPAQAEERLCLNGVWDFQPQTKYEKPEKFETQIIVPSFWNHPELWGYPEAWRRTLPCGWFRRTVAIPAAWQGDRIFLQFERLQMTGQVFFNGRHVANHWDATNPLTVEVTDFVKFGQPNEILVGAKEEMASAGFLTDRLGSTKEMANFIPPPTVKRGPAKKILVPYGINFSADILQSGITRDVWLIHRPPVYLADVFIQTSVRLKEILIDYTVTNTTAADKTITIFAKASAWKGKDAGLDLREQTRTIPAKSTKVIQIKQPWNSPHRWCPDDPFLYVLNARLRDEQQSIKDTVDRRFGFREIWTQGRDIFLNGIRLNIRGDTLILNTYGGGFLLLEAKAFREMCRLEKRLNVNAVRFHGHSASREVLDVCDEEGLMVVEESGLHGSCGDFAYDNPIFWQWANEHLRTMVRDERNHPSIIAWSAENENGAFQQGKWKNLTQLTRTIKKEDPTRLVWHEGFSYLFNDYFKGSPVEGDILSLHYPHGDAWGLYYNFPEASYWAKTWSKKLGDFGRPVKPIGNTEYGLIESNQAWMFNGIGGEIRPCYGTAPLVGIRGKFCGDWTDHYYLLGLSIRGNRYADTAVISPFTVGQHYLEMAGGDPGFSMTNRTLDWTRPGLKFKNIVGKVYLNAYDPAKPIYKWLENIQPVVRANHPLLCFSKEYNTRFWSGGAVQRNFIAFNDLYRPTKLELSVKLISKEGSTVFHFIKPLDIAVGEHITVPVSIPMPKVEKTTPLTMKVVHASDSGIKYEEDIPITVYPKMTVPEFYLFDPGKKTALLFRKAGIDFTLLQDIEKLPKVPSAVVIGEDALPSISEKAAEELRRFAVHGGTVICLAQTDMKHFSRVWGRWAAFENTDMIPANLAAGSGKIPTTIAHVVDPNDPLCAGLTSNDMRFWARDHAVGMYGLEIKKDLSIKPLVICNRPLNAAVKTLLAKIKSGKGQIYLCQLLIADNLADEPAARLLFSRLTSF